MAKRLGGVEAAAFVNDDTQTAVRYTSPHEDTEINVRAMLESDSQDTRGDDYFVGFDSTVEWRDPSVNGIAQLETWMVDATPIQFVAVGPELIIQWYEPKRPRTVQETTATVGDVDPTVGFLSAAGGDGRNNADEVVGFPNGSHRIYASRSALAPQAYSAEYALIDTDSDGVPDGYTDTGFTSRSLSQGVFEAAAPTDGSTAALRSDVLMPLEQETWTLSVDVLQLHSGGDTTIRLAALDSAGTVLTESIETATSTGRLSTDILAPAGTYELRAEPLRSTGATGNATPAQIERPALRVDGKASFVTR